jgi:curved DNA-binding protein CbpA
MAKTLYEILGVSPLASRAELQIAFNKIKRKLNRAGDKDSMDALHIAEEAYAILSNPDKRANYDRKLAQQPAAQEDSSAPESRSLPVRWGEPSWDALFPLADKRGQTRNFPQRRQFLAALLLLALLVYWAVENEKSRRLEARLQADEQAIAQAIQEKNRAIKSKEEAQAQLEQARQQYESEQEARRAELASKQLDLENKRIETDQYAIDTQRELALKQIDKQADLSNRSLEIEKMRAQADIEARTAQTRSTELANRMNQYTYDRKLQDEGIAIMTERVLREKYRQQELSGDDRIYRVNPGMR